VNNIAVHIQNL